MASEFDTIIDRRNTGAIKYDFRNKLFGTEDVIPMWVADMEFPVPDFITRALRDRVDHPIYGYTQRTDTFYEAVRSWISRRHQWNIDKDWITFTPGVVPALNIAVQVYTQPQDKIIIQPPVYFPFFSAIKNHNRQILRNPLKLHNGRYYMDLEDLEQKIDDQTRMLILCSPHNPGGNVWTKEELKALAELCTRHNILIISDEIHSDLVYPGHKHIPTASLSSEIAQNTVTFTSASKTFNLAGLSTAVMITPNTTLQNQFASVTRQMHLSFGNIFGNVATEAAFNNGDQWVEELMTYLQGNHQLAASYFEERIPYIEMIPLEGTYLLWLDCRQLGLNNKDLKNFMVHEAGLGLSDGPMFGTEGSGFQRMNIACPRSKLRQALNQLEEAVKKRFDS